MQTQVYLNTAAGVPGQKASFNPVVYYPLNLLAEGAVRAGQFVWPGSDPELQAAGQGDESALPLGLVERNVVYPNLDPLAAGSLDIPESAALAVAVKGDYWVVSTTAADPGNKAYAKIADGSIAAAPAGQTMTGYVETPWTVRTSASAGQTIIISNWS